MLKCLYCESTVDSENIPLFYPAVYYHNPEDNPGGKGLFICSNGHIVGVSKRKNEPFILYKKEWYPGIPGRLNYIHIYDFESRMWVTLKTGLYRFKDDRFEEYVKQQKQLKSETFFSRLEWLKCACRLGICKDVRLLIGVYMNREPREFWKVEDDWWWCVVQ